MENAFTRSPVSLAISPTTVLLSVPPDRNAPTSLALGPRSPAATASSTARSVARLAAVMPTRRSAYARSQ